MPMLAAQRQLLARDRERLAEVLEDPLGDLDRVGARDVLEQHDELVAAEARGGVARAHAGREPLGDVEQRRVPGLVAEAVVDRS